MIITSQHLTDLQKIRLLLNVETSPRFCAYDDNHRVTEREYADGRIVTYSDFDDRSNPGTVTEAAGTSEERTIHYTYHPLLNQPLTVSRSSVLASGTSETVFDYDDDGNDVPNENPTTLLYRIVQRGYTTDAPGTVIAAEAVTALAYNAKGQLISVDGPAAGTGDTVSYVYDAATGDLLSMTQPLVGTTTYADYDGAGRPGTITDPNGHAFHYTYDAQGRVLTVTSGSDGNTTTYVYNTAGEIDSVTLPDGSNTSFTYDSTYGRLVRMADALGNATAYGHDDQGKVNDIRTLDDAAVEHYRMQNDYQGPDHPGRLYRGINPDGTFTEYDYDEAGRIAAVTDPVGNSTQYAYDIFGRTAMETRPGPTATGYGYDSHDNPASVTDAEGRVTEYDYDDFGRCIERRSSDTGATRFAYNADGHLIARTDANGTTVAYDYDAAGRLAGIVFRDPGENITYTYDEGANGKGRLTGMSDASGTYTYTYDAHGNLVGEQKTVDGQTWDLQYGYDAARRLAVVTYPDGLEVVYHRNNAGTVTGIDALSGGQTYTIASGIEHLPFGPVRQMVLGNGLDAATGYDLRYLASNITTGGGTIQDDAFGRTAAGLVDAVTDNLDPTRSQSFAYDALDRLDQAQGVFGTITYEYDGTGNRTERTAPAGADTYDYETGTSRLAAVLGTNPVSFSLDAAGNTTAIGSKTLTYNGQGRLIGTIEPGQPDIAYAYDGFGRRVKKTVGTVATIYHYDPDGRLLAEQEQDDGAWTNYIYLEGSPVAMVREDSNAATGCIADLDGDGQVSLNDYMLWYRSYRTGCVAGTPCIGDLDNDGDVDADDLVLLRAELGQTCSPGRVIYYYHNDHLGTPQKMTDSSGTVVWAADYLPFGKVDVIVETITNNLRFAGQYFDEETGLHYNYHRYYDPSASRYLRPDPIGLNGGINLFTYAVNDPVNFVDPFGLCRKKGESFFGCLDRHAKDVFGTLIDITDNLGYYGLTSAAIGVGGSALASAGEYLAREGIKDANLAGARTTGNILKKLAASSAGAKTAARIGVLKTTLGVVSKVSGVVGASATLGSVGLRAVFIGDCREACDDCSQ